MRKRELPRVPPPRFHATAAARDFSHSAPSGETSGEGRGAKGDEESSAAPPRAISRRASYFARRPRLLLAARFSPPIFFALRQCLRAVAQPLPLRRDSRGNSCATNYYARVSPAYAVRLSPRRYAAPPSPLAPAPHPPPPPPHPSSLRSR